MFSNLVCNLDIMIFLCRGAFLSSVEQCSGPVYKLVDYGHEDIRRAAIGALTQFTICVGKQPAMEEGDISLSL